MADPYRSNGSAAYDVRRRNTAQPLEQPERLPDAPARRLAPRRRAMSVHVWVSRP